MTETPTYRGSCHCGKVVFEINAAVERGLRCNCSLCRRKGAVMALVPEAAFRLISGEDALRLYQYNTMVARHHFCSTCGIYTHHFPRTRPGVIGINTGCLEGFDPLTLDIQMADGASLSGGPPAR